MSDRSDLLAQIAELKKELARWQNMLAAEQNLLRISREDYWRLHGAYDCALARLESLEREREREDG